MRNVNVELIVHVRYYFGQMVDVQTRKEIRVKQKVIFSKNIQKEAKTKIWTLVNFNILGHDYQMYYIINPRRSWFFVHFQLIDSDEIILQILQQMVLIQ